jgi:hypothetical protein
VLEGHGTVGCQFDEGDGHARNAVAIAFDRDLIFYDVVPEL